MEVICKGGTWDGKRVEIPDSAEIGAKFPTPEPVPSGDAGWKRYEFYEYWAPGQLRWLPDWVSEVTPFRQID